ncbi:UNVERIFIED_CONTAM: hypothetical protein FKN15_038702 [Acipenser sinensis]
MSRGPTSDVPPSLWAAPGVSCRRSLHTVPQVGTVRVTLVTAGHQCFILSHSGAREGSIAATCRDASHSLWEHCSISSTVGPKVWHGEIGASNRADLSASRTLACDSQSCLHTTTNPARLLPRERLCTKGAEALSVEHRGTEVLRHQCSEAPRPRGLGSTNAPRHRSYRGH